jgi:hypothetical protein
MSWKKKLSVGCASMKSELHVFVPLTAIVLIHAQVLLPVRRRKTANVHLVYTRSTPHPARYPENRAGMGELVVRYGTILW